MRSIIKIPFAERAGSLIHVSEVPSGLQTDCLCPVCRSPVVARKGSHNLHHFAHYTETNCQPETVAHDTAKRLLADRIKRALLDHTPLPITWACQKCHSTHQGDLVRTATRVELEYSLPGCRPDLCLLGRDDTPIAALEVIVTHKPEQPVRDYYATNNITLAEYEVHTQADLERLNAEVIHFDYLDLCLRPSCPNCQIPLGERLLFVSKGHCWKCHAPMRIAFLETDGVSSGPEDFTPLEIDLATRSGALLKQNYSRTRQETYLSNTCAQCGALTGDFYLSRSLDEGPGEGGTLTGYSCEECDYRRSLPLEPHQAPHLKV